VEEGAQAEDDGEEDCGAEGGIVHEEGITIIDGDIIVGLGNGIDAGPISWNCLGWTFGRHCFDS
jgi:hypothetical protein